MEDESRSKQLTKYTVFLVICLVLMMVSSIFIVVSFGGFYGASKDKEDDEPFSTSANVFGTICLVSVIILPFTVLMFIISLLMFLIKKRSIRKAIERDLRLRREKEERKRKEIELARNFEVAMRYQDAIKLYEKNRLWEDARRCRMLMRGEKLEEMEKMQPKVDIASLGTIGQSTVTNINDSVINRSNIK